MERLEACLGKLKKHDESISTLYFKPPGIYHNALIYTNNHSVGIHDLIRDPQDDEERALYTVNEFDAIRKDGERIGIMDHLSTTLGKSDNQSHNNAAVTPIVKVPKDYYLKQSELMIEGANSTKHKRRRTGTFALDEIFFNNISFDKHSFVFDILLKKYSNDVLMKNLIIALRDGSVIDLQTTDLLLQNSNTNYYPTAFSQTNNNTNNNRRRTLFVEDFPGESVFKILQDIATNWPLKEYTSKYDDLFEKYSQIQTQVNELKEEIAKQEENETGIEQLIQKEELEIENLKLKLQSMENH